MKLPYPLIWKPPLDTARTLAWTSLQFCTSLAQETENEKYQEENSKAQSEIDSKIVNQICQPVLPLYNTTLGYISEKGYQTQLDAGLPRASHFIQLPVLP